MNSSLFINPHSQDRVLQTRETIIAMTRQIASYFGATWANLTRRVQTPKNFQVPTETLLQKTSSRIQISYNNRDEWVRRNAKNTLVDFRTPVMGEDEDDMVFSESENEQEHELDEDNDEYDSEDDVIDYWYDCNWLYFM